jgi:hypothetical protein
MDAEQSKNFNERLSQWVESQGFWFQLRYSMAIGGTRGWALTHLMRLGLRVLIFLLVVIVGIWVYLIKRTDSARFGQALRQDLQAALSAKDMEMRGGTRIKGQLEISRLAAEGGNASFFSALEARNIRCQMGLVDGVLGIWQPGTISIAKLDMDLRAGADDAQSAGKLAEAVFRKSATFEANTFEIANATVRWGYSERTEGAIESSNLKIQRTQTGWRMNFRGGTFHQNWLGGLEIENLLVRCEPGGLVFEKAEFKQGQGTLDFSGLRVISGERPEVQGTAKIRHLVLEELLPEAPKSFLNGSISGNFQVFGSTNSLEGVGFNGKVVLTDKDEISLREQVHLLKAFSVVDYARNYRRIDFQEGSFRLKTSHGGLELTEVKLKAGNLLTLEGDMKVRLPTQEEIRLLNEQGSGAESGPGAESGYFSTNEYKTSKDKETAKDEAQFTLKRAAREARKIKEGKQNPDSLSLFDRQSLNFEIRRMQSQSSERLSHMLRYSGVFQITLPGDAFERGPKLQARYPADPVSGRIPMMVPIEGALYELTLKQAEEIYTLGRR